MKLAMRVDAYPDSRREIASFIWACTKSSIGG